MKASSNFWLIVSLVLFFVSCETQLPQDPKTKKLHNVMIEGSILPDSVSVHVDSKEQDLSLNGNQISLAPGEYEISLKKAGYQDVKQKIKIEKEKKDYKITPDWEQTLYQLQMVVIYDVNPVSADELNIECSSSNQQVTIKDNRASVPMGKYTITVMHPGYETVTHNIEVTSKNQTVDSSLKALPRNFAIDMVCGKEEIDSSGAKIIIDGNTQLGNTIVPGSHALEIEVEGYQRFSDSIFVQGAGKPFQYKAELKKLEAATTTEQECTLVVKTFSNYPSPGTGVTVEKITVNGIALSEKSSFAKGEYDLVIENSGYEQIQQKITLSGSEKVIEVELTPISQNITIELTNTNKENITPDSILMNNKAFTGKILPGTHALIAMKSGYKTLEKQVAVKVTSEPQTYSFTMEPLPRKVLFLIKDEKSNQEVSVSDISINNQKYMGVEHSLMPGKCMVVIEKDGYQKYESSFSLTPGNQTENITIILTPKEETNVPQKRSISILVMSDSAPKDVIAPQMITLNGLPISKDLKLEPGTYPITIFHPGHFPYNQNIEVSAGAEVFEQKIVLESQSRSIVVSPQYDIDPETTGTLSIRFVNKQTQEELLLQEGVRVKPGTYNVFVERENYTYTGLKETFIAPDTQAYVFQITLKKNSTDTVVDSDTKTDTVVDSDTKTDTVVDSDTKTDTVVEVKECRVNLKVTSTFGSETPYSVNPKIATLNNVAITGNTFLPGEYDLVVSAEGYQTIQQKVTIPETKEHALQYSLSVAERTVNFDLMSDYPNEKVEVETILTGGSKFSGKVLPGEHKFTIQKDGYHDFVQKAYIDLGETTYTIKGLLKAKERVVNLEIVNQATNEKVSEVNTKVNNLGTSTTEETLKLFPGNYEFTFEKEGFLAKNEKISVAPSNETMSIKVILEPKPEEKKVIDVLVNLKVYSDADLDSEIRADILTIENQSYMPGLKLSPGSYGIVAYKSGHQMYQSNIEVAEDQETVDVKVILECTLRSLEVSYNYDLAPAPSYPSCKIEVTNVATQQKFTPEYGQMVKPGKYLVAANQVGYVYNGKKEIFIEPGSGSYRLEISMIQEGKKTEETTENKVEEKAKTVERILRVRGVHPQTFEKLTPYRVIVDGKTYQNQMLKVGQEISLSVLFSGSKTYNQQITIAEGDGEFDVLIDMLPLRKIILTDTEKSVTYDGIKYEYQFKFGKTSIEKHLWTAYEVDGKVEFHLFVDSTVNDILVFAGYRYIEKSLVKDKQPIGRLSKIDVFSLIEHLTKVHKTQGESSFIASLKEVMSYEMSIRKEWKYEEKEEFLYYMQSLELKEDESFAVLEDMIAKMEKMLE